MGMQVRVLKDCWGRGFGLWGLGLKGVLENGVSI